MSRTEETFTRRKKKINYFNLRQKFEIIEKLNNGASSSDIMKLYDISKTTLYDKRKWTETLLRQAKSAEHNSKTSNKITLHKSKSEVLDKKFHPWFQSKRSKDMTISGPMIIAQAKSMHEDLYIDTECKFSFGRLQSFKNHRGVMMRMYGLLDEIYLYQKVYFVGCMK